MVHDYIAQRLNEWANWRLHRQDGGLGYPKQVAWYANLPKSGYVHFSPDVKLVYAKENGLEIGDKNFGEAKGSVWVTPCVMPKLIDMKGKQKK